MARPVKCPQCELSFDRDECEWTHHKNRYYHQDCFILFEREQAQKKKDKKTKAKAGNELDDYLRKLNGYDRVPVRVRIQINQMKKNHDFTESGILKSLQYFYEIKGGNVAKSNGGVGIVPYIYDDARDHYFKMFKAKQKNDSKDLSTMVTKGRVVRIPPPKRKTKKVKLFNITLEGDVDEK